MASNYRPARGVGEGLVELGCFLVCGVVVVFVLLTVAGWWKDITSG